MASSGTSAPIKTDARENKRRHLRTNISIEIKHVSWTNTTTNRKGIYRKLGPKVGERKSTPKRI